ncbi:ATP-binding cassette subfamily C protein [Williamsia limnetica]|uniref:ATP-binding cassette subfamily C protein n=1 Tax=Williamsia limnetica TaxID=882452 RepID=A0A318RP51_WILLI|nr:ABC transporter ATP-binding protein [Williamsia limnetica]PYE18172.1 ATP-binding cassette subfamily C protein [Williamsia limnetica]
MSASAPQAKPTGNKLAIADFTVTMGYLGREMRRHTWQLVLLAVVMTAGAGLGLVTPRSLGTIVDIANDGGEASQIWRLSAIMAASAVGAALLAGLGVMLAASIFESILANLREAMIDASLRLQLTRVETAGSGDLVSRATADVSTVSEAIGSAVPTLLTAAFTVGVTFLGLATLDWRFLIVLVVILPVYVNGIRMYLQRAPGLYAAVRASTADRAHHVLGAIRGLESVHAFRLSESLNRRIDSHSWEVVRWEMRASVLQSRLGARVNLGEFIGMTTILIVGFALVDADSLTIGAVTAAMLFFLLLFDPIGQLLFVVDDLQSGAVALGRIVGVIEESKTTAVPTAAGSPEPQAPLLELRAITHGYSVDHTVLHDISLTLSPGEHVAVVGSSGAGKTTLASIVAGIHRPSEGRTLLEGVDITTIDPTELSRSIALVTQEVHVFAGTLGDDLRMAAPEATDEALWSALDVVGAGNWVRGLSDGVKTVVGQEGHQLTPMQSQQLALARLVLLDPKVAILDEATADAGSVGAGVLEESAQAALRGRSALIIAHRLSQAARADRIVFMERGRIVEVGTHTELVSLGGRYGDLWKAWSRGRAGTNTN